MAARAGRPTGLRPGLGAVGLLLGGLLTTYVSWRWVLFVDVPIGIIVAAAAHRVLAESPRRPGPIDVAGAVTGTVGIALLVYGLSKAATGKESNHGMRPRSHAMTPHDRPPKPPTAASNVSGKCRDSAGHLPGRARSTVPALCCCG